MKRPNLLRSWLRSGWIVESNGYYVESVSGGHAAWFTPDVMQAKVFRLKWQATLAGTHCQNPVLIKVAYTFPR